MSKKMSLAESMRSAMQVVSEPQPSAVPTPPATITPKDAVAFHATTRVGKKKVTAPLAPEDHKRLRRLALDRDATTKSLLVEAINDLFAKYGVTGAGQGSGAR